MQEGLGAEGQGQSSANSGGGRQEALLQQPHQPPCACPPQCTPEPTRHPVGQRDGDWVMPRACRPPPGQARLGRACAGESARHGQPGSLRPVQGPSQDGSWALAPRLEVPSGQQPHLWAELSLASTALFFSPSPFLFLPPFQKI